MWGFWLLQITVSWTRGADPAILMVQPWKWTPHKLLSKEKQSAICRNLTFRLGFHKVCPLKPSKNCLKTNNNMAPVQLWWNNAKTQHTHWTRQGSNCHLSPSDSSALRLYFGHSNWSELWSSGDRNIILYVRRIDMLNNVVLLQRSESEEPGRYLLNVLLYGALGNSI